MPVLIHSTQTGEHPEKPTSMDPSVISKLSVHEICGLWALFPWLDYLDCPMSPTSIQVLQQDEALFENSTAAMASFRRVASSRQHHLFGVLVLLIADPNLHQTPTSELA